jgi:hypothetical protein
MPQPPPMNIYAIDIYHIAADDFHTPPAITPFLSLSADDTPLRLLSH